MPSRCAQSTLLAHRPGAGLETPSRLPSSLPSHYPLRRLCARSEPPSRCLSSLHSHPVALVFPSLLALETGSRPVALIVSVALSSSLTLFLYVFSLLLVSSAFLPPSIRPKVFMAMAKIILTSLALCRTFTSCHRACACPIPPPSRSRSPLPVAIALTFSPSPAIAPTFSHSRSETPLHFPKHHTFSPPLAIALKFSRRRARTSRPVPSPSCPPLPNAPPITQPVTFSPLFSPLASVFPSASHSPLPTP
ncbi:unnamed protein product [Closterium sp. NIES-53]